MPRTDGAVTLYHHAPLWCFGGVEPGLRFVGAFDLHVPTDTGHLFPDVCASGDVVLTGAQGHGDGQLRLVIARPHGSDILGSFGPAINVNPVAIRPLVNGWEVAVVRSGTTAELLQVTYNGSVNAVGTRHIPETSQGITSWDGQQFTFADPTTRFIAGRRVSEPSPVQFAPGWSIGQDNHGNRIVFVHDHPIGPDGLGIAWEAYATSTAQRPKAVRMPNGMFAVTASEDGPRVLTMRASFADDTIGRPPAQPSGPAPPVVVPVPPVEEPAVPEIPNYFEHVQRVWAKHGGPSEEAGAKVTRIVAYDLAHGLNGAPKDARVGLYRKRSTSTIQDRDPDKLCFNLGGGRIAFVDIVGSAGSSVAHASWQAPHFEQDDNPQDFTSWVAPEPEPGVHGTGSQPAPAPTPVPPPVQPPVDLHVFLTVEYPKLVAEFMRKRPELGEPGHEWAAFQCWRRAVERWSFQRVFDEV